MLAAPAPRGDRQHPAAPRRRRHRAADRPPRPAQLLARAGQGRPALQPRRRPRRGARAGDVDDLEVRPARRAVRRRQGRRPDRPAELLAGRARARDPPLHQRDQPAHRAGARHPRARHRHRRADHGLDDGHLLRPAGLHRPRRRHRQAGRASAARWAARPPPPAASSTSPSPRSARAASTPTARTAAVQGFGKVGRYAARFLAEAGVRVVGRQRPVRRGRSTRAASTSTPLEAHVDAHRLGRRVRRAAIARSTTCWTLDVDLLVPAAVEGVHPRRQRRRRVRAPVIVEGANGPTTPEADAILAGGAACSSYPTSWPTPAA